MNSGWLQEWFFGQVDADAQRLKRDPGLPAYPWRPDGTTYTLSGVGLTPLSFVYSARSKRYPVLVNLDEMRRSTQVALAGTPDTRKPSQKSHDAWLAFQAAKEKYDRTDRSSAGQSDAPGTAREAREAAGSPEGGQRDGQEPEAGREAEGAPPAP